MEYDVLQWCGQLDSFSIGCALTPVTANAFCIAEQIQIPSIKLQ